MSILRALIGIQLALFLWAPPIAVAALAGKIEWLLIGIPWALICVFLYGWVQGRGIATFEEFAFPLRIRVTAKNSFHLTLFKVNAAVALILLSAMYYRGVI